MAWPLLIAAGLLEVIGVVGIKRVAERNNFTNNLLMVISFLASFLLLAEAMKTIPLATAYAVWTGVGTVGAAIVGMICFHESKSWIRMITMLGIILSIVGLKVVG